MRLMQCFIKLEEPYRFDTICSYWKEAVIMMKSTVFYGSRVSSIRFLVLYKTFCSSILIK